MSEFEERPAGWVPLEGGGAWVPAGGNETQRRQPRVAAARNHQLGAERVRLCRRRSPRRIRRSPPRPAEPAVPAALGPAVLGSRSGPSLRLRRRQRPSGAGPSRWSWRRVGGDRRRGRAGYRSLGMADEDRGQRQRPGQHHAAQQLGQHGLGQHGLWQHRLGQLVRSVRLVRATALRVRRFVERIALRLRVRQRIALRFRSGSESPFGSGSGTGNGSSGSGTNSTGSPADTAAIAAKVSPALVDINSTFGYQSAQGAGTGIVLTSNGEILTNNHVINGATKISVTDVGNGKTYTAKVVGYDDSHDIAVLQLQGASGLQTAKLADSSTAAVGAGVVAIGNAGGTGGTPSYAGGSITALNQSITASDDLDGANEQLTGLIEVNANIQPGDSGGSLVNTAGSVHWDRYRRLPGLLVPVIWNPGLRHPHQ